MCKNDQACSGFRTRIPGSGSSGDGTEDETDDMVCYKGGLAVEQNFQMCDVTSEQDSRPIIYSDPTFISTPRPAKRS